MRPVARLHDAVDVLVELDPVDLTDGGLADELIRLRREMDRQEAVFARLAHAAHVRGLGSTDGAASTAAFLRHRAGMREGDAKAAIECGAVSELLAETGRRGAAGEISTGATRTIVAARVAEHDDTLVACEPELLASLGAVICARCGGPRRISGTSRSRTGVNRGDQDGLHISHLYDGRTVISGELSNVGAETVVTALHAYVDPPSDDDTRTTSQRYAAALVRMAEVAITHLADDHRTPTQVSIVVDWATLTGGQARAARRRVHRADPPPRHPTGPVRQLDQPGHHRTRLHAPRRRPRDAGPAGADAPRGRRPRPGVPVPGLQSTTGVVPGAPHDLVDQRRTHQSQRPDPVL